MLFSTPDNIRQAHCNAYNSNHLTSGFPLNLILTWKFPVAWLRIWKVLVSVSPSHVAPTFTHQTGNDSTICTFRFTIDWRCDSLLLTTNYWFHSVVFRFNSIWITVDHAFCLVWKSKSLWHVSLFYLFIS